MPSRSITRHMAAMPARRSAGPVSSVPNGPRPAALSRPAAARDQPAPQRDRPHRARRGPSSSGCIAPHIRTDAPLASGRARRRPALHGWRRRARRSARAPPRTGRASSSSSGSCPSIRANSGDGDRLERRHAHVQVEVVAVGRVDVVAQPEPGVGEHHLAVGHAPDDRAERPAARRLHARVDGQRLGLRPQPPALEPRRDSGWSWLPAAITTCRPANASFRCSANS